MTEELKLVVEMEGDRTTFTSDPTLSSQSFSSQGMGPATSPASTRDPRIDQLLSTFTNTAPTLDLDGAFDIANLQDDQRNMQREHRQFIHDQKQANAAPNHQSKMSEFFSDPGSASSFLAAGVAQGTGSVALGGAAGGIFNQVLQGNPQLAGRLGPLAFGATIASEINNSQLERQRSLALGTAQGIFSQGTEGIGSSLSGASEYADPIQKLLGINLIKLDDQFRILIETVGVLDQSILSLSADLSTVSPEVAQAQAQAELTQLNTRFERADTLGPALAEYLGARSEINESLDAIRTEILQQILPPIASIARGIEPIVQNTAALAAGSIEISGELIKAIPALETFVQGNAELLRILGDERMLAALDFINSDLATAVRAQLKKLRAEDGEIQKQVLDFLTPTNAADSLIGRDIDRAIDKGLGGVTYDWDAP